MANTPSPRFFPSGAKGTLALLCYLTASAAYKPPPLRHEKCRPAKSQDAAV